MAPVMVVCSRRYLAKLMFARRVRSNATRFVAFGLTLRQRCNPLALLRGHTYVFLSSISAETSVTLLQLRMCPHGDSAGNRRYVRTYVHASSAGSSKCNVNWKVAEARLSLLFGYQPQ